jgi:hypothetical protein
MPRTRFLFTVMNPPAKSTLVQFELDPDFDSGAIHGFLIDYELARQGASAIRSCERGSISTAR